MYVWMPDWSVWTAALNEHLSTLFNLRVLRLSCQGGSHLMNLLYPHAGPFWTSQAQSATEPYYFDAVLSNCVWPHLRSLTLAHWPMRGAALASVINSHAATLRELELDGISLLREKNVADDQSAWLPIAETCAGCKKLRYLQISNPQAHHWFRWDPRMRMTLIFDEPSVNEHRRPRVETLPYDSIDDIYRAAGRLPDTCEDPSFS